MARTRLLRQRVLSMGQALAAGLRAGLAARQVPVWLDTPMTGLHLEDGRAAGVEVTRDGQPALIRASRGVVLAAGGFERNAAMRQRYQRPPIGTEWTTGSQGNTGDAIAAGEAAGAALDLMDDAWWGPSIPLPSGPYFCLAERSLPGCLLVNGAGQRFVNESAPYVDAVHAMYEGHTGAVPHIPSWLIFDQRYRNSYVFAGLPPGKSLPRRWSAVGSVHRAATVAELAASAGLDPQVLAATVTRFNGFARAGRDEDFHRGDSAYDRYYGDPRRRPNPNLAPLDTAAVLCRQDRPRRPRHQGRPAHRCAGPGAARRRHPDSRPVRGGQHQRRRDGPQLRRRGRHHRPGDDVRLHRRARPRRRALIFMPYAPRGTRPAPGHPPPGAPRS